MTILFALILTLSMIVPLAFQPTAKAHTPPWTVISYGYVVAAPQPVRCWSSSISQHVG